MKKKLVSIIIPYFKKKKFIEKSIYSAINQTYKKIEIIVIYDDPDTGDLNFIKKIILKDKRIKLIVNKKNLGAGLSRNIGINKARGDYIAFLDADDIWKFNKIETQLDFMTKKKIFCSHTSYNLINKKNKIIGFRKAKDLLDYNILLKSCDIGLSTVMINKEILSNKLKFSNLKTKEDFLLWINIMRLNYNFYSIDRVLSSWRQTEYSLSSSAIQKICDSFRLYHFHLKFNIFKSLYYVFILSINYLKK